jgi:hypothetical protein
MLREVREKQKEQHLAVGFTENVTAEPGRNSLEELWAMFREVLDVAVVRHDPFSVLKWMTVEHGVLSARRASDMGEHRFRSDNATHPLEECAIDRSRRAAGNVRRTVDVEGYAPAVPMVRGLRPQGVVGVHQGSVYLALDHTSESEQATHNPLILTRTSRQCSLRCSGGEAGVRVRAREAI